MKKSISVLIPLILLALYSCASGNSQPASDSSVPETQPADIQQPAPLPQSPYFSGSGGQGMRLAILVPEGKGIAADQNYLPAMVQGVFVDDMVKYSAITVLDRLNLETLLKETESGIYKNEADFVRLGEIANVGFVMTGAITKTSSNYLT